MKYYKLLSGNKEKPCEKGKIYSQTHVAIERSVDELIKLGDDSWQEVPASEYWIQEGKLPEKWYVKTNENNYKVVKEWANFWWWDDDFNRYIISHKTWTSRLNEKDEFTEITFDQFKQYVLGEEIVNKDEVKMEKPYTNTREVTQEMLVTHPYFKTLTEDELLEVIDYMDYLGYKKLEGDTPSEKTKILYNKWHKMEKEIIGYKCPKDLFNGTINKGEIFETVPNFNSIYRPKGHYSELLKLPKEIVETWEPVYKQDEYKVGEWLYSDLNSMESIFRYKSDKGDTDEYHQVNKEGFGNTVISSSSEYFININNKIAKATPEQIKRILTKVAVSKGFKEGIKCSGFGGDQFIKSSKFEYSVKSDQLYLDNFCIYNSHSNDKWAEILPSYPDININGYKGEFFDWGVKFGCAEIAKEIFTDLLSMNNTKKLNLIRSNREIESVTIGKGTFTKDQIKKIAEYYLNK